MRRPLKTGYVCMCCGKDAHHSEVIADKSHCCGSPCIEQKKMDNYPLFSIAPQIKCGCGSSSFSKPYPNEYGVKVAICKRCGDVVEMAVA